MNFQREVDDGMHQRMTRMNQAGHRFTVHAEMLLFKANPFVFGQHGRACFSDNPVAFTDGGRHVADFEAAAFARS